jgi:hypothetical protein
MSMLKGEYLDLREGSKRMMGKKLHNELKNL